MKFGLIRDAKSFKTLIYCLFWLMQRVLFLGEVLEPFLSQQFIRLFSETFHHLVTRGQWLEVQTETGAEQRQNLRN
jgi:hypothetical protein